MSDTETSELIKSTDKPKLSFGISSILGRNRPHRLLPNFCKISKRKSKSAFQQIRRDSEDTSDESEKGSHGAAKNGNKEPMNKCHGADLVVRKCQLFEETVGECHSLREPVVKCHSSDHLQGTDLSNAINLKSDTDIREKEPPCCSDKDSSDQIKHTRAAMPMAVAASPLSLMSDYTTQNLLLKSLDKFRPNTYSE